MSKPYYNLPNDSVANNARLFANRYQALDLIPNGGSYLEVGVLGGDYSEVVINKKSPTIATLVDTYLSDDWYWRERFNANTHLDFVRNRFANMPNIDIKQGNSGEILKTLTNKYDYIYIDARHDREFVFEDLSNSYNLLNHKGIIGLNDYIIKDPFRDYTYGVVSATNEFLESYPEFKIIGFAFNEGMYSDIYIQKSGE